MKRAAIYVRVSTDHQTVENQIRELRQVAERRGWEVVEVYSDAGISGAKDRKQRPGLDRMLNDAGRRKFDIVMAWAIDRVGRSLIDLLGTIQHLDACGVDLYLDQQNIDTSTPMGKLVFQVTGAFAEFERSMIRQRVHAGLRRAVAKGTAPGTASDQAGAGRTHPRGAGRRHEHSQDGGQVRREQVHGAADRQPFRPRPQASPSRDQARVADGHRFRISASCPSRASRSYIALP